MGSPLHFQHFGVTVLTTCFFIITVVFVRESISGSTFSYLSRLSPKITQITSALAILRVLQGITSTLTSIVLGQTLELIGWSLACREPGLRLLSFLSISPTTSILGMLLIVTQTGAKSHDRDWVLCRLALAAMIWLSGFVLFFNISVGIANAPSSFFNTTAGVGLFNGSFVEIALNGTGSITYQALAYTADFVTNDQFSIMGSPVSCSVDCDSYVFPGALWSLSQPPADDLSPDTLVNIYNAPAIQMDFQRSPSAGESFFAQDCTVYGGNESTIGIELCLAESRVLPGSIIAGIFVCTYGVTGDGKCNSSKVFNISTTLTIYTLRATATCAWSNNSILSVNELEQRRQGGIDLEGLHLAMNWLLNDTAEGLPAISSVIYLFWDAQPGLGYHDWSIDAYRSLKNLLAFPIWLFSPNNYGDTLHEAITADFNTTASLCRPYDRIIISPATLVVYVVLQSLVLLFFWAVIVWRWASNSIIPDLSPYPLVDFRAKLVEKSSFNEHRSTWDTMKEILMHGNGKAVIKALKDIWVIRRRNTQEQTSAVTQRRSTWPLPE